MSEQKFTAFSFNAANVQPAAPLEPVPAAFYPVTMTDGEIKPTANGSGKRLAFELTIGDGPFKGRKIWDGLNIENQNPQAQQIAHEQLSAICHATGVINLSNVQELYGKPFTAKIGYEPAREDNGKTYDPRNTFKGAKPLEGGAPAPAASGAGVPAWANKSPATPAPAAASASAPAPNPATPPASPPFAQTPAAPAAPPKPVLTMTAKANGMTAEQFRESDPAWTDEMLIQEGYAEMVTPAAPEPAKAPTAATPAGQPVAPPWAKK